MHTLLPLHDPVCGGSGVPQTRADDGGSAGTETEASGWHDPLVVGVGDAEMPKALLHLPCTSLHVPVDRVTESHEVLHSLSL